MLRLQGMEIHGFKSFRDRVQIAFPDGITGVVGPNGCGKSNILDAISWVLGEQSARHLRGQKMEDLIFNGSGGRNPAGMAEVKIALLGTNGQTGELLEITRRLFRTGDSEYAMNGARCRLRDIHETLAGTGMGVRAYSIIEQGKVEQILSGKAVDRRLLIEEAAGVTAYRGKRHAAQLKLEAAGQNLARLTDILAEIENQRNSLKRQSSAARRFRELKERERLLLRVEFGRRHGDLRLRIEAVEAEHGRAADAAAAGVARSAELDARLERKRAEIQAFEERLVVLRDEDHERLREMDRAEHRILTARERMAEASALAELRQQEAATVAEEARALGREAEEHERLLEKAGREMEEARAGVAASESQFQNARGERERLEAEIEKLKEELFEGANRIVQHRNAIAAASDARQKAGAREDRLAREEQEVREEEERLEVEAGLTLAILQDEKNRLEALRAEHGLVREEVRTIAADLEATQDSWQKAIQEEGRLESRLHTLAEMEEAGQRCASGVRALLETVKRERAAGGRNGFHGLLADAIRVEPGCERAVEGVLGERLEWLLVRGIEDAREWARQVESNAKGGATFLYRNGGPGGGPIPSPGAEASPLRDRVKIEGKHAGAIEALLDRAFLVPSGDSGARLHGAHPDLAFVTPEGMVFGPGPRLRVPGGAEGGLLALQGDIRETRGRLAEIRTQRTSAEDRRAGLETALSACRTTEEGRDAAIRSQERACLEAEMRARGSREERERARQKRMTIVEERGHEAREVAALTERIGAFEIELCFLDREKSEKAVSLDLKRLALEEQRAEIGAAEEALRCLREVLAAARERREAARLEWEHSAAARDERKSRAEALRQEAEGQVHRRGALEGEAVATGEALVRLRAERQAGIEEIQATEGGIQTERAGLGLLEAACKEARAGSEEVQRRRTELQVELAGLRAGWEHLEHECRTELSEDIETVAGWSPTEEQQAQGIPEGSALSAELDEIRQKLSRIGAVNLMAIEEYEEVEKRYQFLKGQEADVRSSIEALQKTIAEIDEVCRTRFVEAFEAIQKHFDETFRELFRGGVSQIRLENPEDLLESGVEVFAQPPGKRLQNIMLLSGGEKALSAIALLFAIFKYKPSPFCILDEVDAPLDDANLQRFLDMVERMKTNTQFVLITHNKKSMERANRLYGVTMEEPGVSKLVSVDFSRVA